MKPYVVFFTSAKHGYYTMFPVFKLLQTYGIEASIILVNRDKDKKGFVIQKESGIKVKGRKYKFGSLWLNRKPDLMVGFCMWWFADKAISNKAKKLKIPLLMINHGAMFIYNDKQHYKKDLAGAKVNCIWGEHDLNLWLKWLNDKKRFAVTGNPLHDSLIDYKCPDIPDLPDEYALVLTPTMQHDFINQSIEEIQKIMPVVVKCHPNNNQYKSMLKYYKQNYQVFTEAESLIPLIHKAKIILSNVTSALMPALYWQKPIFIHSYQEPGYYFNAFKKEHKNTFNFKKGPKWDIKMIEDGIKPTIEDYIHFAHLPDGKNTERVCDVIRKHLK